MPLTLHHGPASPQKQGALKKLLPSGSIESTLSIESIKDWHNFFKKLDPCLRRGDRPGFENLIIANLYPLHAGQRGILRQLAKNYPKITIHVFYDESFEQTHGALDAAYQDLGQMADESIYYDPPTQQHAIFELKTPIHETRFVVSEIKKQLINGAKPENIVIVLLDTEERMPLERALLTADIPYTLDMALALTDVLPPNTTVTTESSNNVFLQRKIQAQQLAHESEGRRGGLPLQQTFTPPVAPNAIILTTLDRALAYKDKQIFLMGLSLEHLMTKTEELYETDIPAAQNEFVALIQSPSYRMHVAFVRLQQLLGYGKNVFLTRTEMDRASQPLMRVGWQRLVYAQAPAEKSPLPHHSHSSHHSYNSHTPSSFSVSSLQEYLDCPYSFYAKYVLKAAPLQKPTLEPDGKIRGSFVHDVLRKLFQAYGSQLLLPEALNSISEKIPALIERAAQTNEELKTFPLAVVQEFTGRVTQTIRALITREASDCAEKKKQTLAKFCEWDFGRSHQRAFEIITPDGPLQVTGRIDRVDINEEKKQFTVIDFKTGELPTKEEILSGQALQLPLYLMAIQKTLLPTHAPSAALYYGLKKNRVFGFALKDSCDEKMQRKTNLISQEEWQEVQDQVLVHCVHIVHQVHQGNFDPKPHNTKKCEHCDYRRICGCPR